MPSELISEIEIKTRLKDLRDQLIEIRAKKTNLETELAYYQLLLDRLRFKTDI